MAELDPARRDELLLRLDTVSDGWRPSPWPFSKHRRGAAICGRLSRHRWRRDLARSNLPPRPRRSSHVRGESACLALAVLIAFGAGWLTRPVGESSGQIASGDRAFDAHPNLAHTEADSEKGPAKDSVKTASEPDNSTPQIAAEMRRAGVLMLQLDDHGKTREVQVPVLDASGIDVRRLLEQAGWTLCRRAGTRTPWTQGGNTPTAFDPRFEGWTQTSRADRPGGRAFCQPRVSVNHKSRISRVLSVLSFNRDSPNIPESRRTPTLPGMFGEERVSVAKHALVSGLQLARAVILFLVHTGASSHVPQ